MDEYTHKAFLEDDSEHSPARPPRPWLGWAIAAVIALALIAGGIVYWLDARHYESTDDAFVDAHISPLSAQVGGRVVRLLAEDNKLVAPGQVLVELDPRDAQMRLDQMLAQRDQAAAGLEQARATLPVRQAELDQAHANIRISAAELQQSHGDLARYIAVNPRAISAQTIDSARSSENAAQARVEAARQAEAAARAQLAVARTQVSSAEAALRLAQANVADTRLKLSYTQVTAPAAGRIARRTVELGAYVAAGQSLLAVVQPECWVTANFKESQLADMRPGQPVRFAIDAVAGKTFDGHVASLQPGTGSVFSSLPAENATGNYVKVVQRLPVKLVFEGDACRSLALAPGMSVEPRVKVR